MFSVESEQILKRIHADINAWRTEGMSESLIHAMCKEFRALSAGATAEGFDEIATLSTSAENLLKQSHNTINTAENSDDTGLRNLFEEIHDGLSADLGFFSSASQDHVKFLDNLVNSLLMSDAEQKEQQSERTSEKPSPKPIQPLVKPLDSQPTTVITDSPTARKKNQLAALFTLSGGLGIARARMKHTLEIARQRMETLRTSSKKLCELSQPMRHNQLGLNGSNESGESNEPNGANRRSELNELGELSTLKETVTQQIAQFGDSLNTASNALNTEFYLGERLHADLLAAQLTTFNDYLPQLQRFANNIAEQHNQPVDLSMRGSHIGLEVDRLVVEGMVDIFECLISNSIKHGGSPESRSEPNMAFAAPAPAPVTAEHTPPADNATTHIVISITQLDTELLVEYTDDGNGIDKQGLVMRALELGMTDRADKVGDQHSLQIITHPECAAATSADYSATTSNSYLLAESTHGMQTVYQTVRELNGSMALQSDLGKGVRFQFHLPQTLVSPQALIVKVGEYQFAIIACAIERVTSILESEQDIVEIDGKKFIYRGEQQIPIISVARQLNAPNDEQLPAATALILIRVVDRIVAYEVTEIEGMQTIVNRHQPSPITSLHGTAGVAMLTNSGDSTSSGASRIVTILDPGAFINRKRLCYDGLIQFPLSAFLSHADSRSTKATMRVMSLSLTVNMNASVLLIPLSMIAEMGGAWKPQPGTQDHQWIDGTFFWRGLDVPVVNAARAFNVTHPADQACDSIVILQPLEDRETNHFFALAVCGQPKLIEVDAQLLAVQPNSAESPSADSSSSDSSSSDASSSELPENELHNWTNLLGCVQLEHGIGIIPDLKKIARQIFRKDGDDPNLSDTY